jgi:hypothetical protein
MDGIPDLARGGKSEADRSHAVLTIQSLDHDRAASF